MGAAIQAGIIKGEVKDVLLLDVTPLALGIETLGGVCTKLIERNTTIPTRRSQVFSTAEDNQTAVTVRVLQGERPMAADNVELGRFDLVGIPSAPRGLPQIEVAFDIDADGIVHVSAKDLGTGKEQSIRITAPRKLSKDEIGKMVQQAEQFADADKQRRELAETKNQADQLVYTTEKNLKELGGKIGASDREAIEQKAKALKELLTADDAAAIKRGTEELLQASHKLAEAIYKQRAKPGPQAERPSPETEAASRGEAEAAGKRAGGDDKVVDAEYKVQDDPK
jgi:molecular chaperone DnaK